MHFEGHFEAKTMILLIFEWKMTQNVPEIFFQALGKFLGTILKP